MLALFDVFFYKMLMDFTGRTVVLACQNKKRVYLVSHVGNLKAVLCTLILIYNVISLKISDTFDRSDSIEDNFLGL